MSIPALIIGDVTLQPTQRLPTSAFTATPQRSRSFVRAEDGTGYVFDKYEKYDITISGLALDTIPGLRRLAQTPFQTIDLYSIVDREEILSATGTTSTFFSSRKMRLDDGNLNPVVEYPIGTAVTNSFITFVNTNSIGQISLSFNPLAGTNNVLIRYYPVHIGVLTEVTSDYTWNEDEENWNALFQEI